MSSSSLVVQPKSVAIAISRKFSHPPDSKGRGRGRPKCEHCGCDGHWKANFYKLHGYPGNKSQSRGPPDGKFGSSMIANNVTGSSTSFEIVVPGLTSEQYRQLLDLLSPSSTTSANFASNLASCHSASFSFNSEWVVDLGA